MLLCLGTSILSSCSEVFEEPIDDERVALLSPGDHFQTSSYLQTFLWEEVADALYYRLQIASPGFDSAAFFAADTVVEGRRFTVTLPPGEYQWRVRALNGSSMTGYSVRNLLIHPSSISNQTVQLLAPGDKIITRNDQFLFEWNALFGATIYRLQIDTNNFSDEENVVLNNTTPNTRFNFTLRREKSYQWRVRAENDTAQSKWSSVRIFTLDQTPPGPPSLTAPLNNQRIGKPVGLQWNSISDAVSYRLYVYKSDSTTLFNSSFPLTLKSTSHSFNLGEINERVYWRVRAIDAAGNESSFSSFRNFVIDR